MRPSEKHVLLIVEGCSCGTCRFDSNRRMVPALSHLRLQPSTVPLHVDIQSRALTSTAATRSECHHHEAE